MKVGTKWRKRVKRKLPPPDPACLGSTRSSEVTRRPRRPAGPAGPWACTRRAVQVRARRGTARGAGAHLRASRPRGPLSEPGLESAASITARKVREEQKCFLLYANPCVSLSQQQHQNLIFLRRVIRFLGLSTLASPIYKFGGKSVGRRFLFVSISIIDSIAAGLSAAVLSTKLLQEKKKKRIIKRISLKGLFSRLGELKLNLPAVFWFVARACT